MKRANDGIVGRSFEYGQVLLNFNSGDFRILCAWFEGKNRSRLSFSVDFVVLQVCTSSVCSKEKCLPKKVVLSGGIIPFLVFSWGKESMIVFRRKVQISCSCLQFVFRFLACESFQNRFVFVSLNCKTERGIKIM